jgi:hypothetical protein
LQGGSTLDTIELLAPIELPRSAESLEGSSHIVAADFNPLLRDHLILESRRLEPYFPSDFSPDDISDPRSILDLLTINITIWAPQIGTPHYNPRCTPLIVGGTLLETSVFCDVALGSGCQDYV